jgi:pyruvate dehydrogenase (quinone)
MEHCDALVMLGTDFPYRPFFPEGVPVIQVDVRGEHIGRRVTYGTDLDNPDFAGMARAAGLFGVRVDKAGELEDALKEAFGHDGPALVDVRTARQELSLPPNLTYGQIKGFTLWATRTVLSGGGTELVELAKTNLRELEVE